MTEREAGFFQEKSNVEDMAIGNLKRYFIHFSCLFLFTEKLANIVIKKSIYVMYFSAVNNRLTVVTGTV